MSGKRRKTIKERQTKHSDRCINPFENTSHVGKSLRRISKRISKLFSHLPENSKICHDCRKLCVQNLESRSADDTLTEESQCSDVDYDVSPTKKTCLSREQELEELLLGLKQKFTSLPENDPLRVTILTVAPESWSIRKIAVEFNTSFRMAKHAKDLRKSGGVLASPPFKKGKNVSDETVSKVVEFYENDCDSRIMPHKKETVTVKIDDRKEKRQKRLLLCDIKVLHMKFKEKYPTFPIGFSKFAELRPKWCVTAGTPGTHTVCVCIIHQNVKTMIDAINLGTLTKNLKIPLNDYKDCMHFVLCKNRRTACYLRECKHCPAMKEFSNYVIEVLMQNNILQVIFSMWQSTDRCTLKQECLPTEDFVDQLCDRLESLITHHFISKSQSEYLAARKQRLRSDEVLLQCDFAENYAYVAQDAAQAFHYNNDQCTVFTVLFYYTSGNEIKHYTIVLLSDCTIHDTAAVYLMQEMVIPEIRKICPTAKKIIYVSDGAKQHFKNRYQMSNLMKHKDDFGIEAEWHFHATAHGKGACDGIGATLKREATRYSLQVDPTRAILKSEALFIWAKKKFANMRLFYYSKESHKRTQRFLHKRFSCAPPVSNIQMSHAFIPISKKRLKVMRYSDATDPITIVQY